MQGKSLRYELVPKTVYSDSLQSLHVNSRIGMSISQRHFISPSPKMCYSKSSRQSSLATNILETQSVN
jgi:hypothetical protein